MSPAMKPRKAKVVRMWSIREPAAEIEPRWREKTRKAMIYVFCLGKPESWPKYYRQGYRAVRVTVREEV